MIENIIPFYLKSLQNILYTCILKYHNIGDSMKKIFAMFLSLLLVICGCSCDNSETFTISKLETYTQKDIKTYGMVYKKHENGSLLSSINVISRCHNLYCEYYIRKDIFNKVTEEWYIYNDTNYTVKTKENGVKKADKQVELTFNDKQLPVHINTLMNYVTKDVEYFKEKNKDFTYKVEDSRYITELKSYTLAKKLAMKTTNTYSFKGKDIDKLVCEKENYGNDEKTVISIEKVEIEVVYESISIPAY